MHLLKLMGMDMDILMVPRNISFMLMPTKRVILFGGTQGNFELRGYGLILARCLKAQCFRQMAFREICANWYGTYLTAAHELEGTNLLGMIYSSI